MATKKLTVEVDADASKAKRKIKRDLSGAAAEASSGAASGGAAPASSSAATKAERLAKSLERAGKNAEEFGKRAAQRGRQISNAFKSRAGLGAGRKKAPPKRRFLVRKSNQRFSSFTKGFSFVRNSMRSGVPAKSNFSRKKLSR